MNPLKEAAKAAKEAYLETIRINNVNSMFKSYKRVKDNGCRFINGGGHVKRTEVWVNSLIKTIENAIDEFEPWIRRDYYNDGKKMSAQYEFVGRCLSDNNSPVYEYWQRLKSICPECKREYGQPYYAYNCKHNDSIPEWKEK